MPTNPSTAQSLASRRNGAMSQGPKTDEGKQISSQNSLRHGLFSETIKFDDDEMALVRTLRVDLFKRQLPGSPLERNVVESMVNVRVKLCRLDKLEFLAMEKAIEEALEKASGQQDDYGKNEPEAPRKRQLPSLATLARYRSRLLKEYQEAEAYLALVKRQRQAIGKPVNVEELRFVADQIEAAEREQMAFFQPDHDMPDQEECQDEPEEPDAQSTRIPVEPPEHHEQALAA